MPKITRRRTVTGGTAAPPTAPASAAVIATIDLAAVRHNYRALVRRAGAASCAAVVKGDGYGLGMLPVATVCHQSGARSFFVARLEDGIALRETLDDAEVAILDGLRGRQPDEFTRFRLQPVLGDVGDIERWFASERPTAAFIHIDTGMNRLGVPPHEFSERVVPMLASKKGARIAGYMTHLVSADEIDIALCRQQVESFRTALAGAPAAPRSIVNSSGLYLDPNWVGELARPGKSLAGINPLPPGEPNPMRQAMLVEAPVLQVRRVGRGDSIGYSEGYRATRPIIVATLGIGYTNGYLRSLTNRGVVAFHGIRAPVVGRVSMDLVTVDVTDVPAPALAPGVAEMLGPTIGLSELAQLADSNEHEMQIALGRGCPRKYIGGD